MRDAFAALNLIIRPGEILGLLGHNGAGKTSLLKSLAGVLAIREGDVLVDGISVAQRSPLERIELGVTYLPQGNPVFPHLTVRDNLLLRLRFTRTSCPSTSLDTVLDSFPQLKERLKQSAGSLSGGEKQMLSLAGALLTNPRFLLLDEPSLGLAPSVVSKTFVRLRELTRDAAVGILMVEQKVREALRICDELVVLKQGQIVFAGPCSEDAAERSEFRELCL
jgi:branched-chain amino acid transport system ATP-binding protein